MAPEVNEMNIAVVGAGSWGTTLAALLAWKGLDVTLWVRREELCRSIRDKRVNDDYLPGVRLPASLGVTTSLSEALEGADLVLSAVPSHGLRSVFEGAAGHIKGGTLVVSATKGIEQTTLLTPSGILSEVLGPECPLVVLSGPSFAKEVSRKLPTAVSAASDSPEAASTAQKVFSAPYFRVYTNRDRVGVELGGALKNVIAIASGISDGLGLGHNSRAALITRGLAEMSRLGKAMGADAITFMGLSGLGDLVLTCTGELSRNYTVGRKIGNGLGLEEVTGPMKMVAEGVKTSVAARELASRHRVEMPIVEAVYRVLHSGKTPLEAVSELMTRELKEEGP